MSKQQGHSAHDNQRQLEAQLDMLSFLIVKKNNYNKCLPAPTLSLYEPSRPLKRAGRLRGRNTTPL